MPLVRSVACTALALLWMAGLAAQRPAPDSAPITAADLFQTTHVWTVRLTLSPQAWKTLAPVPSRSGEAPRTDGFRGPEGKRNGLSGLRGLDFEFVHAAFDLGTRHFADVGVRYKGNGTYRAGGESGKISFKVDLNKYVKGQKLAGVTTLNLHSNITDPSWMNEVLAYRLYRDAGVPAPRTAYARVSITVPGQFANRNFGLYSIVENVDSHFADERYGVTGGAIFKPVTQTPFSDLGKAWTSYQQTYDPKTDLLPTDEQRLIDFCAFVSHATDAVFSARLAEFVDLDAFAKYTAVVSWLANPDSPLQQGQNYYLYLHPKTRQLAFVPWDQDHSFGQFGWSSYEQQRELNVLHPWTQPIRFWERVFRVEAFKTAYLARLAELNRTLTHPDRLARQVDELAAVLGPIVAQEPVAARVATFRQAVAGDTFVRPYYGGNAQPIKPFVRARNAAVLKQLRALGLQ